MDREMLEAGVDTMLKVVMDILATKRSKLMISTGDLKESEEEG
jgi:hypothetical protein